MRLTLNSDMSISRPVSNSRVKEVFRLLQQELHLGHKKGFWTKNSSLKRKTRKRFCVCLRSDNSLNFLGHDNIYFCFSLFWEFYTETINSQKKNTQYKNEKLYSLVENLGKFELVSTFIQTVLWGSFSSSLLQFHWTTLPQLSKPAPNHNWEPHQHSKPILTPLKCPAHRQHPYSACRPTSTFPRTLAAYPGEI